MTTGVSYGDPVGGTSAVAAVALALLQRDRAGAGCHVDLAQREAAAVLAGPAGSPPIAAWQAVTVTENVHTWICAAPPEATVRDPAGAALPAVEGHVQRLHGAILPQGTTDATRRTALLLILVPPADTGPTVVTENPDSAPIARSVPMLASRSRPNMWSCPTTTSRTPVPRRRYFP